MPTQTDAGDWWTAAELAARIEGWEAAGDYAAAFAMIEQANAASRQGDSAARMAAEERSLAALVARFTPQFFAGARAAGPTLQRPIFIVGMPRSGSTLVEQILASHPRVQALGEISALVDTVRGQLPFAEAAPLPGHYGELARRYLVAARAQGLRPGPVFTDKRLPNHQLVGMIHLMFPQAMILHCVRDAADTCFSCWRTFFEGEIGFACDLAEIGHRWRCYRALMDHWEAVLPGRVVDVDHEALVADPEARIRWLVTEACGLPFDDRCLRYWETTRDAGTASADQVRRPIFTTSLGRWRPYADRLGPLFEALGPYAPSEVAGAANGPA